MAFDGGFLYKIVDELKEAIDCHIDKIYQPSRDELVFLLRKKGFAKRLLITAKPGSSRIHFTENKYENPPSPPMFCQLLRKYLSSARLTDIKQSGLERVAELHFSATNEMGDRINIKLICELIGNQSNIILVNEDGRIIESVRHSDVETASRLILPGAIYEYPPTQDKINPINNDIKSICSKISLNDTEIWKAVLSVVDGFSPLICREIENTYNTIKTAECDQSSLEKAINSVLASLNGTATPTVLFKEDGAPYDFSYVNIDQYGTKFTKKNYNSCCELLDAFYTAKDTDARMPLFFWSAVNSAPTFLIASDSDRFFRTEA